MKKCDLVMKGGVTSGIVYPGAVCELSKEYAFANIGGTSAGAIAAALTAAAEFRRQSGAGEEGFRELAALPEWLGAPVGGSSRLLRLFQPSEPTAPLFEIATAAIDAGDGLRHRAIAAIGVAVKRFQRYSGAVAAVAALLAALAVAAIIVVSHDSLLGAFSLGIALVLLLGCAAVAFVLAAAGEAVMQALRTLPRQGFGLCSGMTETRGGEPGLTDWLTETIDSVAGREADAEPLTFGDLWSVAGGSPKQRTINLEMMTTNLTHGRPYRFPAAKRTFYFAPGEMRRLFPARVVDWMIACSRTTTHRPERPHVFEGEELLALPQPADLPVVVATRMSLSFPLLLSAVPLYAVDYGREKSAREFERCWFSDGGITSNFPVHFFDAPLPRWPTFAFNLAERTSRYHDAGQRIYLPRSNAGGVLEWWTTIESLPSFLWSIVTTMQNWRDNMLLRMPGQRDRIAHVLLSPREGGLHLTMEAETIEDVARRGAEAAAVLRARFGERPPAGETLTWRNHKWVRFRAFMRAQERAATSCVKAFDDQTEPPSFRELFDAPQPSYAVRLEALRAMRESANAFIAHAGETFEHQPFGTPRQHPKPVSVLRAMPEE